MSIVTQVETILKGFLETEEAVLLPQAAAMVSNLAAAPSLPNAIAQGNAFLAQALADQAGVAKSELQSLAATLAALAAKNVAAQAPVVAKAS